jgi:hypothetical protein
MSTLMINKKGGITSPVLFSKREEALPNGTREAENDETFLMLGNAKTQRHHGGEYIWLKEDFKLLSKYNLIGAKGKLTRTARCVYYDSPVEQRVCGTEDAIDMPEGKHLAVSVGLDGGLCIDALASHNVARVHFIELGDAKEAGQELAALTKRRKRE